MIVARINKEMQLVSSNFTEGTKNAFSKNGVEAIELIEAFTPGETTVKNDQGLPVKIQCINDDGVLKYKCSSNISINGISLSTTYSVININKLESRVIPIINDKFI